MNSITSREDVIKFLQDHSSPLLQCEFMMHISSIGESVARQDDSGDWFTTYENIETPDNILLTAFDCPDSGVSWSAASDKFGFVRASLKYSQINVSFISPIEEAFSPIHQYYDNQFDENGLIKASNNSFAKVIIFALVDGLTHLLFSCSGCRFSYPIPAIDLSNPKISIFRTTISYNSFRYGI